MMDHFKEEEPCNTVTSSFFVANLLLEFFLNRCKCCKIAKIRIFVLLKFDFSFL